RTVLLFLLVLPVLSFSQSQQVFIKLTDNSGQLIKGEAVLKGYERAIEAITMNSTGKNNTQLDFTMQISGASADLKRAMNVGQRLSAGEVTVITPNLAAPTRLYTIKMEQITVLSCSETMGCNNTMTTTVSLQATRIGWTYYAQNKTGATVVSRKYGWDSAAGAEWSGF